MRKLILISAFVLASASAQAGDIGSLIPAASDASAEATPAAADAAARPAASRKQASSRPRKSARRETDEQKARQIAAQYGISW